MKQIQVRKQTRYARPADDTDARYDGKGRPLPARLSTGR